MSAWINLYCKRSLTRTIPEEVQACVDAADWWTLAEGYGIEDEDVVDAALDRFRVEPLPRKLGESYRVYYRPRRLRQIDVWRWTEPRQEADLVAEDRAALKGLRRAGFKQVREHLTRIRELISIELGWGQLEGMPVVLAYEIARWLAHITRAWIKDHEDQWWRLTRGGAYRQVTSS